MKPAFSRVKRDDSSKLLGLSSQLGSDCSTFYNDHFRPRFEAAVDFTTFETRGPWVLCGPSQNEKYPSNSSIKLTFAFSEKSLNPSSWIEWGARLRKC